MIGKTASGKPIQKPTDPLYTERAPAPKWNIEPNAAQFPKHLFHRLPDWAREDHEEAAQLHLRRADFHEALHQRYVRKGEAEHGGREHGPLISGGFYDHWPEKLKDKVRKHAHAVTAYRGAWWAHSQVAKMRDVCTREMIEISRMYEDDDE